ncbi:PTS transporter subunit EIIB (plasmid) [Bacillus sp. N447-1]|uniref:PTS transporter subunit EIIB n=1 Tax=Bacillus sp. N447-1 TaxID=2789208 RepID=UPI001F610A01|nr:PTS transporter subunit EIIB [Bacillus sp. N447-1]UNT71660.1 PTS transporter subunit EIIB [Bacillus sp. N447-1]
MNVKRIVNRTLQYIVDGKENVISSNHFATRLRLILRNKSKVTQTAIEEQHF